MAKFAKRFGFGVLLFVLCSLLLFVTVSADEVSDQEMSSDFTLTDSLASIAPMSTTTPTYWSSSDISTVLNRLEQIFARLGGTSWTTPLQSYLAQIQNSLNPATNGSLAWQLTSNSGSLRMMFDTYFTYLAGVIKDNSVNVSTSLGFPEGETFYNSNYRPYGRFSSLKVDFPSIMSVIAGALSYDDGDSNQLTITEVTADFRADFLRFMGLFLWGGNQENTLPFALDSQNDLAPISNSRYKYNNVLSRLVPLFYMQNDLARITAVVADPLDQELKDANKKNEQAVVDNFTGDKGLQDSSISDMSGIGDSLGSLTDTGVSVSDGFAQINQSWGFFSANTASQLDTVPVVASDDDDDDYVDYYDPENTGLNELLSQLRGEGN